MHSLFGWISEAADWLLAFAKEHPESAFAVAFASAFAESFVGISFFVPGFTILIGLGFLIAATDISFWPVWLGAAVGAILGDWISYALGHRYKNETLSIWPISKAKPQMERGLGFFRKYGVWAIFLGRFTGPLRATVPLIAGISQMHFWPFQLANVTSALLWAAVLLAPGAAGYGTLKDMLRGLFG